MMIMARQFFAAIVLISGVLTAPLTNSSLTNTNNDAVAAANQSSVAVDSVGRPDAEKNTDTASSLSGSSYGGVGDSQPGHFTEYGPASRTDQDVPSAPPVGGPDANDGYKSSPIPRNSSSPRNESGRLENYQINDPLRGEVLPPPYSQPHAKPCKGNCALKNNMLPKYKPDDGGKLKCPEDDGREFRAKDGTTFTVVCYADFAGRTMKTETEVSLDSCIEKCTSVRQCKSVVFVPDEIDGQCHLKYNDGRKHVNPFVMSARLMASNCADGSTDCERHNRLWALEQEEARKERYKIQLEEARRRIEDLQKEREKLEQERFEQRMQRLQDQRDRESKAQADAEDKARYEEYVQNEIEYRRRKDREYRERERQRLEELARNKWLLATEEQEKLRIQNQVDAEREALKNELDGKQKDEWSENEAWWRDGRFQTHPTYEVSPKASEAHYGGGPKQCDQNKCPPPPEFQPACEDGYPTDDEWDWYPDPTQQRPPGPLPDTHREWMDQGANYGPVSTPYGTYSHNTYGYQGADSYRTTTYPDGTSEKIYVEGNYKTYGNIDGKNMDKPPTTPPPEDIQITQQSRRSCHGDPGI